MNEDTPQLPPDAPEEADATNDIDAHTTPNGRLSPSDAPSPRDEAPRVESAANPVVADEDVSMSDQPKAAISDPSLATNGDDDGGESEAETLIGTPAKKKEAEKQVQATTTIKAEKPIRSRIGGLPVPGEDDEDSESIATPLQSTEMNDTKRNSNEGGEDGDLRSEREDSSESLSSPGSSDSQHESRLSSEARAISERMDHDRDGTDPRNPRKRKHRASSVGLPNKRQSMDPPRRKLRGMQSEDNATHLEKSPSPRLRNHRRAVSTQSAFEDVSAADGGVRKRRTMAQFPVRDPGPVKAGWEDSDASSEATSHGQMELRRPQRGIGRSTSTPGRQAGREHKRHVNKYGFTKLAEACDNDDLDAVKEWRDKDPDQLELPEFAGNKPLQIAALRGNDDIVAYLIDQGCQIDCANVDKDTPLIDAAENGHSAVVKILLRAGVDPLRQNLKGQQALDVVTDETDEVDEIRAALRQAIESWNSDDAKLRREEEEEQRHRAGPTKELHFMARTYENLLHLVQINDRNGVREFLDARVPVDNAIISAAAKTGDQYLVNMLLAEMTEKKAYQKAEKPMLAVLGTSHFEMVKMLTSLDQFNPLYRSRAGKTWREIAEERNGPNMRLERELLQRLADDRSRILGRRSSSPVTKRDQGKRRPANLAAFDDSDEDEAPKRKNGRRLMSRRDMRAASGKAASDSDSDGVQHSTSDDAPGDAEPMEASTKMKPPESPMQGPAVRRPRTKSASSQPAEKSPRNRRRSSASRGGQDTAMPTWEENGDIGDLNTMEQQREAAAKTAIEEAQRLEAKRRVDEEADAEAKRVEEEMKRAEEVRQREEEGQARLAEEDAQRVEAARQAEEQRKQRELDRQHARSACCQDVLASLPSILRQIVQPSPTETSPGQREQELSVAHALDCFTPLLVVREDYEGPWALNVQAAPLLGKRGLELLLPRNHHLEFETTYSRDWPITSNFSERERREIQHVLDSVVACETFDDGDESMIDSDDFRTELGYIALRLNAVVTAKHRLNNGTVPLFCVRVQDVLSNLHPMLKDKAIEMQGCQARPKTIGSDSALRVGTDGSFPAATRLIRIYEKGKLSPELSTDGGSTEPLESSEVLVVHEK